MPILPALSVTDLAELLKSTTPPRLLDVREPAEYVSELGHVANAELLPLGTIPQHVDRFANETREIICICKSGMRSQQAAGFLAQRGLSVRNLTGGMMAWNDAKLPISRDPA